MLKALSWKPVAVHASLRGFRAARLTHTDAIGDLYRQMPNPATLPPGKTAIDFMRSESPQEAMKPADPSSRMLGLYQVCRELELSTPRTPFTALEVTLPDILPGATYIDPAGSSHGPFLMIGFHWTPKVHNQQPPYGVYKLALDNGNFVHFDLSSDGQGFDPNPYIFPEDGAGYMIRDYLPYVYATSNALRFVALDPLHEARKEPLLEIARQIDVNLLQLRELQARIRA